MRATGSWQSTGGGTGLLNPPLTDRHKRRRPRKRGSGGPPRTPDDPGDGDGGGGGDDDADEPSRAPEGTAQLGLALMLVSIGVLFGVFLLTAALMVSNSPASEFVAPLRLWISTAFLVASSATMSVAARSATRVPAAGSAVAAETAGGRRRGVGRWLAVTFCLGTGFLVAQIQMWRGLVIDGWLPSSSGYGGSFYALTGLHALHVLGGLLYMSWLLHHLRRSRGRTAAVAQMLGARVRLCATYWHFMGVVWVLVFVALWGLSG